MSLYDWLMDPRWKRRWELFWMIVGILGIILALIGLYNLFTKGWVW